MEQDGGGKAGWGVEGVEAVQSPCNAGGLGDVCEKQVNREQNHVLLCL